MQTCYHRVEAGWFGWSLVVAEKLLYAAALRDPRNQQLVLVSETDIPLYPPAIWYLGLLAKNQSYVELNEQPEM